MSTPGALERLSPARTSRTPFDAINEAIGAISDASDWEENEASLSEGFRLLSVYRSREGERFWVITEADRSATTVLLPDEY